MKKILIFTICLFFIPFISFAYSEVDIDSSPDNGSAAYDFDASKGNLRVFQTFTASEDISAIKFWGSGSYDTSDITLHICKGDVVSGSYSDNFDCLESGQTLVKDVDFLNFSISTSTDAWHTFEFLEPLEVVSGDVYFFSFQSTGGASSFVNEGRQFGGYSGGSTYYYDRSGSGSDLTFQTLYLTDATFDVEVVDANFDDFSTIEIGSEKLIVIPASTYCSNDTDCFIDIKYSFDIEDGDVFHIVKDEAGYRSKLDAIASTTLTSPFPQIREESIQVATSSEDYDFCVIVEHDSEDTLFCSYSLLFGDFDTFQEDLYEYDIDDACDSVATSSGSTADDFRYGFECGIRKVGYWFVYPQESVFNKFNDSRNALREAFPFSIVDQIHNTVNSVYLNASSTNYTTLDIDTFIPDTINGVTIDKGDTVWYSWEKVEDGLYTAYSGIEDIIIKIFYLFTFLYFFFRIFNIINKARHSV